MNGAPELLPGIQADLKREHVFEPSARLMIVAVKGDLKKRENLFSKFVEWTNFGHHLNPLY